MTTVSLTREARPLGRTREFHSANISPYLKIGLWETKLSQSFAPTVNRQFKGIFLAVKIH